MWNEKKGDWDCLKNSRGFLLQAVAKKLFNLNALIITQNLLSASLSIFKMGVAQSPRQPMHTICSPVNIFFSKIFEKHTFCSTLTLFTLLLLVLEISWGI